MMPGETGFDLAKSIRADLERADPDADRARRSRKPHHRASRSAPTITVAKPFEPRELSLRIANILKRAQPAAAAAGRIGALRRRSSFISRAANCARGEEIIRLTDREREMLRMLAATPGETVPRLALAGNGGSVNERAVDVQVNRLRRKIERDPANPLFVQTVRGIGYRLVVSP